MKDTYYFSHDANARNDEKILMLRAEHRWEGYGIFWALIEMMFEARETCLYHDKIKGIALSYNIDITLLQSVINTAIAEKLFVSDGEVFWSESLRHRKSTFQDIRNKRSKAGKKGMESRWGKSSMEQDTKQTDNSVITKNNKGKERKVKESKVKNLYSDFSKKVIKLYPGKKTKSVRDKKLPKILKEYDEEEITRCIERYSEEVKGKEITYILNEGTFWNGRYMDYLDENYKEQKTEPQQEQSQYRDLSDYQP